jgi:hypothetical protein
MSGNIFLWRNQTIYFEGTVTRDEYLDMLQIYVVPGLQMHRDNFDQIYFQQDGPPPHYTVCVHEFLDNTFGGRGRHGSGMR